MYRESLSLIWPIFTLFVTDKPIWSKCHLFRLKANLFHALWSVRSRCMILCSIYCSLLYHFRFCTYICNTDLFIQNPNVLYMANIWSLNPNWIRMFYIWWSSVRARLPARSRTIPDRIRVGSKHTHETKYLIYLTENAYCCNFDEANQESKRVYLVWC